MSSVELLDSMGSDLSVCNDARESFEKESEWEFDDEGNKHLKEKDKRLIQFLARGMSKAEYDQILSDLAGSNDVDFIKERVKALDAPTHFTPFAGSLAKFRIRVPIFVARQWFRHTIGFNRNEVSRRYVKNAPTFENLTWRAAPEKSVKQGSGAPVDGQQEWQLKKVDLENKARRLYDEMLEEGLAPEQARAMLPQSTMTEFIETGSLAAYARLCKQRLDSHAQKEIQDVAAQIDEHMRELFPVSWAALIGEQHA